MCYQARYCCILLISQINYWFPLNGLKTCLLTGIAAVVVLGRHSSSCSLPEGFHHMSLTSLEAVWDVLLYSSSQTDRMRSSVLCPQHQVLMWLRGDHRRFTQAFNNIKNRPECKSHLLGETEMSKIPSTGEVILTLFHVLFTFSPPSLPPFHQDKSHDAQSRVF